MVAIASNVCNILRKSHWQQKIMEMFAVVKGVWAGGGLGFLTSEVDHHRLTREQCL
jgi:hypothetical protein